MCIHKKKTFIEECEHAKMIVVGAFRTIDIVWYSTANLRINTLLNQSTT